MRRIYVAEDILNGSVDITISQYGKIKKDGHDAVAPVHPICGLLQFRNYNNRREIGVNRNMLNKRRENHIEKVAFVFIRRRV